MKSKDNDKITLSENASFMEVMQNIKVRKRTEKNRRNKSAEGRERENGRQATKTEK